MDARADTSVLLAASGSISGAYSYSAWGQIAAHTGTATTPLQWGEGYRDVESGFVYLQARYFDPSTAEFVSVDPLVSTTLQAYQYANNQPIDGLDPTGRAATSVSNGYVYDCSGTAPLAIGRVAAMRKPSSAPSSSGRAPKPVSPVQQAVAITEIAVGAGMALYGLYDIGVAINDLIEGGADAPPPFDIFGLVGAAISGVEAAVAIGGGLC